MVTPVTCDFDAAGPHRLRDGTTVTLRRVGAADTDLFVEYLNALSVRSRHFFHPFTFDRTGAESVTGNLGSQEYYRVVATVCHMGKEAIVGYAWLQGLGGLDIPMLGIAVVDDYHERGIGKILLQALLGVGRSMGLQAIRLGVNDDNPRAIHVYGSVGFQHDPGKPPEDRGSHKQIYMVHHLGEPASAPAVDSRSPSRCPGYRK